MSSTSGHVLSTAMHRRIEHIAAELLICRSPASISNYIFSAVFTYFLEGFLRKKRWLLGLRPRPRWGSLQRSPTPPSWAGGVPPSRTLPGPAPPTTSSHPLPHPRRCPPPPNSWIRHCKRSVKTHFIAQTLIPPPPKRHQNGGFSKARNLLQKMRCH